MTAGPSDFDKYQSKILQAIGARLGMSYEQMAAEYQQAELSRLLRAFKEIQRENVSIDPTRNDAGRA